ncbi:MAG TPA: hypothetical protein VHC46_05255 [Thermodesulfobacteriota bacterium]|nr:hypothetical protein [Thermodesulfobacteriota bacterium]
MAKSTLVLYEPLGSLTEKSYYWNEYVRFYEQYWGGPTSPFGVWFGNEYESFVNALSENLGMARDEIEHCFFTKDEDGKYYIAPFRSKANLFFCENFIPFEWFIPFSEEDRQTLYTHWGFNALHYDTRVRIAVGRLEEAANIVAAAIGQSSESLGASARAYLGEHLSKGIAELTAWLSGFDPGSFLVLNYGELCSVINPYSLENERSVGEMWKILGLLKEGKYPEAESSLTALMRKWEDIRDFSSGTLDSPTLQ